MIKKYNKELDNKYLQNKLIENVIYNITDNYLHISTPSTLYVDAKRVEKLYTKKELLELYNNVLHLAKDKNIKVSYNKHYKKYIVENYDTYIELIEVYSSIFDKLLEAFTVVKNRDLHYGTRDDYFLDIAHNIQHKYYKVFLSGSVYSKINGLYNYLIKLYNNLLEEDQSGSRYDRIYL